MSSRISVVGSLLVRYFEVIKISWRSRKKLEPEKRNAQEREFLPALLEVVDSPPSLAGRTILWVIIGFLVLAMAWSVFGEVDIVAVANGKVIPSGRSKVVQPLEAGVIKRIYVKEGQSVEAGELLIELDPTLKQADLGRVSEGYVSAQVEAERYQALLNAIVGSGKGVIKTSLLVSSTLLQSQQAALDGEP
jgi:hemolysin D